MTSPLLVQIVPRLKTGGVETGVLELDDAWTDSGGRSWVLFQEDREEVASRLKGRTFSLPVGGKSPFSILKASVKLRRLLGNEPALLLTHSRVPHLIGLMTSTPSRPWVAGMWGLYRPHAFSKVLSRATRVWVASSSASSHAREKLGVSGHKIEVHPRGIDPTQFEISPAAVEVWGTSDVVLGVGRLTHYKGVSLFVRAFALAKERHPSLHGVWLGPIESQRAYDDAHDLIKEYQLSSSFHFVPAVSDPRPWYQRATVVVSLPPITPEAFGRTLLEAMASGRAVVSAAHGGPLDFILDKETGLLVPPGDHESAARAICTLLDNPTLRKRLANRAQGIALRDLSLPFLMKRQVQSLRELHPSL